MLVIVKEQKRLVGLVFFFLVFFKFCVLCAYQAEHLVTKGRPLAQQEFLDSDVQEVRTSKRSTIELLEAERLDDLETCMVSI